MEEGLALIEDCRIRDGLDILDVRALCGDSYAAAHVALLHQRFIISYRAKIMARDFLECEPDGEPDARMLMYRGAMYMLIKKYEKAYDVLMEGLGGDADAAHICILAQVQHKRGNYTEAVLLLEKVSVALDTSWDGLHAQRYLAEAYIGRGMRARAMEIMDDLLAHCRMELGDETAHRKTQVVAAWHVVLRMRCEDSEAAYHDIVVMLRSVCQRRSDDITCVALMYTMRYLQKHICKHSNEYTSADEPFINLYPQVFRDECRYLMNFSMPEPEVDEMLDLVRGAPGVSIKLVNRAFAAAVKVYNDAKKYERVRDLCKEDYEFHMQMLGAEHWKTVSSGVQYSESLCRTGDMAAALEVVHDAHHAYLRAYKKDVPTVTAATRLYTKLLLSHNFLERAEEVCGPCLYRNSGMTFMDIDNLFEIGQALFRSGRRYRAIEYFRALLEYICDYAPRLKDEASHLLNHINNYSDIEERVRRLCAEVSITSEEFI